jgi:hypothetical protein
VAYAVFRDNLPLKLLDEFEGNLKEKWEKNIQGEFSPHLFVSTPFFLDKEVYAVFNVNVRVDNKKDWRRACHDPWLKVVRDRVAPIICEAYLAYQCLVELEDQIEESCDSIIEDILVVK